MRECFGILLLPPEVPPCYDIITAALLKHGLQILSFTVLDLL